MDESTFKNLAALLVVLAISMIYTKIKTDRIEVEGHVFVLAAVAQTKIDGTNYCNLLYREVKNQ